MLEKLERMKEVYGTLLGAFSESCVRGLTCIRRMVKAQISFIAWSC